MSRSIVCFSSFHHYNFFLFQIQWIIKQKLVSNCDTKKHITAVNLKVLSLATIVLRLLTIQKFESIDVKLVLFNGNVTEIDWLVRAAHISLSESAKYMHQLTREKNMWPYKVCFVFHWLNSQFNSISLKFFFFSFRKLDLLKKINLETESIQQQLLKVTKSNWCLICNLKFINETAVRCHFLNVHQRGVFMCKVIGCTHLSASNGELRMHCLLFHSDIYTSLSSLPVKIKNDMKFNDQPVLIRIFCLLNVEQSHGTQQYSTADDQSTATGCCNHQCADRLSKCKTSRSKT